MARLPTVGGDSGNWGTVLNEYLATAHKADGTLKLDVQTIDDLKAIDVATLTDKQQALVAGYSAAGDGGGGTFYYDAAASTADNGGTILAPNAGAGRWSRNYAGQVDVRWFGAIAGGSSASAAFTAASAAAGETGIFIPQGVGTFTLTELATITCPISPLSWRKALSNNSNFDLAQTKVISLTGVTTITRPQQVGDQRSTTGLSADRTYPSRDQWGSFCILHRSDGTFDLVHHVNPRGHTTLWQYRQSALTLKFYSDLPFEVIVTNYATLDGAIDGYKSWAMGQEFVLNARKRNIPYVYAATCSAGTAAYATGTFFPWLSNLTRGKALVWMTQWRTNAFDTMYPDYTPTLATPKQLLICRPLDAALQRRLMVETEKTSANAIYLDLLFSTAPRRCHDRTGRHGHCGYDPESWLNGCKGIASLFSDREVVVTEGFNEQGLSYIDIWLEPLSGSSSTLYALLPKVYGDVATVIGWKNYTSDEATKLAEGGANYATKRA